MNENLKYDLIRSILFALYMEDKISFVQWQTVISKLSEEYQGISTNSLAIVKTQL